MLLPSLSFCDRQTDRMHFSVYFIKPLLPASTCRGLCVVSLGIHYWISATESWVAGREGWNLAAGKQIKKFIVV